MKNAFFDCKIIALFIVFVFFLEDSKAQVNSLLVNAENSDIKTVEIRSNQTVLEDLLFITENKIYFSSNIPEQFSIKAKEKIEGGEQFRIFGIDSKGDYKIQLGDQFFLPLKKGEGSFTFLNSRKEILITLEGEKFNRKNPIYKIFYFVSEYGVWKKKAFPLLDSVLFSCRDPFFSKESNKLYFSAKSNDSNGGYDLYESLFSDGAWSPPRNMGELVNSDKDELSAFTDRAGTFYFISDRTGNKDVYSLEANKVGKLKAEVLNSTADETGFFYNSDTQEGFISRYEKEKSSIVKFFIPLESCNQVDSISFETLCYEFDEETSRDAREDNSIGYEWDFGDGARLKGTKVDHCFANPGKYLIQLNVIDQVTGTIFYNQSEYELEVTYSNQLNYNFEKLDQGGYSLSWSSRDSSNLCTKSCVIENGKMIRFLSDSKLLLTSNFKSFNLIHYFVSGSSCVYISEQLLLTAIQKKSENLLLTTEVDRNPSKREKREINEIFGEDPIKIKEADAKFNYKINLGHSEKFYPDLLEDYSIDKNLEIILDSGKQLNYYVGDFDRINDAIKPTRELFKKGLITAEIVSFVNGIPQKLSKTVKDKNLDDFVLSDGYDLHFAFYYDKDVSVPRKEEWAEFSSLMKTIKDRKLVFQVNSYTDYTGTEEHNEKLARDRNKIVIDLLYSNHGINKSEIGKKTKNNSPKFANKGESLDNQKLRRTDVYIKFVN